MTLSEAAKRGITRLRLPWWANENAYVRIDIVGNGQAGVWLHLYDRAAQEAIGEPTPQSVLCIGDSTVDYEAYQGKLDREDQKPDPKQLSIRVELYDGQFDE